MNVVGFILAAHAKKSAPITSDLPYSLSGEII